jgi:AraC-like DNA-binding protein
LAARERTRVIDPQGGHSRLLFASELVRVGTFDVAREDPAFDSAGVIRDRIELVFPAVPVAIEQEGSRAFIADAMRVVWYQPWQHFRRRAISRSGDHCLWLGFAPECVDAALSRGHGAARLRDVGQCRGPGANTAQLAMARADLRRSLARTCNHDQPAIEESALRLLMLALDAGVEPATVRLTRHEQRCVWRARELLGCRFAEALPLSVLAREVGCSPFHLARAFRRATGHSLHAFQARLRLRDALDRLAQGDAPAGRVALDLGFCSHSHFSAAFGREYGVAPSGMRSGLRGAVASTAGAPRAGF